MIKDTSNSKLKKIEANLKSAFRRWSMFWNFRVKVNNRISKVNLSKYQNGGIGQWKFNAFLPSKNKLPESLPDKRKMGKVYERNKTNYDVVNESLVELGVNFIFSPASYTL
jgi:hypothetical protein